MLFSIARPMISTRLLRLPRRGALGNGLRVVAGAVLASEGSLAVITRNHRLVLHPERDGSTTVVSADPITFPFGTRIEIAFGPALPQNDSIFSWAEMACRLGGCGSSYLASRRPGGTISRSGRAIVKFPATALPRR
jgi:hypothetical protein